MDCRSLNKRYTGAGSRRSSGIPPDVSKYMAEIGRRAADKLAGSAALLHTWPGILVPQGREGSTRNGFAQGCQLAINPITLKTPRCEMAWLGRSVPVQHEEPNDDDQSYRCDNHVCNHLRSPHSESLLRDQFERIAIVLHPQFEHGAILVVVTQVTWRCGCGHRQICRAEGALAINACNRVIGSYC